jgi:rubredoxin
MADFEEKRKDVAHLYAGMSDAELQSLADAAWSLTEIGKEALRAELGRRGLAFNLATVAAPKSQPSDLITLRKFRDLPEALLAKGFLESAGVDSFLADETTIRMDWLWSDLLGGVKLWVNPDDAETANQILNQEIPERFDVEGNKEFEQPRCPQCQSVNISFEDMNKPVTYAATFVLSLPLQFSRRRWKCQSCGYTWHPTEDESKETT